VAESPYTTENFDPTQEPERNTARLVVPLVIELLRPESVCHVGCGRGTWLSVFREHGVDDVWGVDGQHAEVDQLEIPAERFIEADLREGVSGDRRFDLVLCLEIAQNLPRKSAGPLVEGLVGLGPAVLFSAGIPNQTGEALANEQWPDYWATHFRRHGFIAVDCIRPRIWDEHLVQIKYAQNTLLFVEEALLDSRPRLKQEFEQTKLQQLSVVHPKMWQRFAGTPSKSAVRAEGGRSDQPFDVRLRSLDPTLFDHVPSETTESDRVSLLALHNASRETYGKFSYLEIGSHVGGSLQALVVDDQCTAITSIDARPASQPDARGRIFGYPGNSTERMLAYLRGVPGANLDKLRTVDASTEDLPVASFEGVAQFCFIDAEHTHDAALRDARFCRGVVGEEGAIAFHDRRLVQGAIDEFIAELDPGTFTAYSLADSVFVIELGSAPLVHTEWVSRLLEED
jgi:methyltransferase family protein